MAPLSILVIDDENAMCETLIFALAAQGYRVITASDGREGLRKFLAEDVALVITDIVMPEIDGIGVLRKIKEASPQTPVIVMSGWRRLGRTFYLEAACALGADDSIAKPFTIQQMKMKIDHCISR